MGAQVIATQEITLGLTSQALVFDCPDGRPSAVTSVTVYEADADDTATAEAATTGSAFCWRSLSSRSIMCRV